MMQQHFVRFLSPGTFMAEDRLILLDADEWNVEDAVELAAEIVERHGARPYAFQFITRGREDHELDSKVIKTSPMYYLKGRIETLQQIKDRNDPKDKILISNMEGNGYNRVISTVEGWSWTQPLKDDDIVIEQVD